MRKLLFSFFIVFTFVAESSAQFENLANRPYLEQRETLTMIYSKAINEGLDSLEVYQIAEQFQQVAKNSGDERFVWEAAFLKAYYELYTGKGTVHRLIEVQKETEELGHILISARIVDAISKYYWFQVKYESSLQWHLHLDDLLKDVEVDDFPEKALYQSGLGSDYLFFGDYEKSKNYSLQVAKLPVRKEYLFAWRHAVNNLGHAYRELGKLDSSDWAFQKLLDHTLESGDEQWIGIASGNVGNNYFLRDQFDKAVPLLKRDVELAENFKDWGLASGSLIPLAEINMERGDLQQAKNLLDKAYAYILKSNQSDRLRNFYPVLSKYETSMNHPGEAARFLDSAIATQKRYNEKFSALQLMRANQAVMNSQREKAIQRLNEESKRNKIVRNFIIGGLLLILISFLIIYQFKIQKSKVQKKLQDQKLENTLLELENAKKLLGTYTQKIHENTLLIQSIKEQGLLGDTHKRVIQQLRESTILTEEDWENFQRQFHKVFPGFHERIVQRFSNLSPSEIRYLLLLKLELPNHEIAHALGISPASLRVTWHRLRKKLDLGKETQPKNFFEMVFKGL